MQQIEQILKENDLSLTFGRKRILELFIKANSALAHAEIEKELHLSIDRVTVYRTLQRFCKKGIIHLIPTTDDSIKYALTHQHVKHIKFYGNHPHFYCRNCNKTTCLHHINMPQVELPKDYEESSRELVITGFCKDCK